MVTLAGINSRSHVPRGSFLPSTLRLIIPTPIIDPQTGRLASQLLGFFKLGPFVLLPKLAGQIEFSLAIPKPVQNEFRPAILILRLPMSPLLRPSAL